MAKVLLTGASGFVGSCALKDFRASGLETFGVGRRPMQLPGYFAVDLSQPVPDWFRDKLDAVEVIVHGAARSSPWGSLRAFHRDNVIATDNVIRLAQSLGTPSSRPKLIFISSSSVYYEPRDQYDITESTPQAKRPVNHYAATKQQAEELVRAYEGPWCILRPRAIYGVGDSVLFPRILAAARAGRLPWIVRTGQPAVGDLLSIDNLIDCLKKSVTNRELTGEFNLTDNEPVPMIEFLSRVFQRLSIPEPRRKISVDTAFRLAWWIEHFYRGVMPFREPPITRFGVHVFAYSKTFDVTKMLKAFGPPRYTVADSVDRFVSWVKTNDPYHLSDRSSRAISPLKADQA